MVGFKASIYPTSSVCQQCHIALMFFLFPVAHSHQVALVPWHLTSAFPVFTERACWYLLPHRPCHSFFSSDNTFTFFFFLKGKNEWTRINNATLSLVLKNNNNSLKVDLQEIAPNQQWNFCWSSRSLSPCFTNAEVCSAVCKRVSLYCSLEAMMLNINYNGLSLNLSRHLVASHHCFLLSFAQFVMKGLQCLWRGCQHNVTSLLDVVTNATVHSHPHLSVMLGSTDLTFFYFARAVTNTAFNTETCHVYPHLTCWVHFLMKSFTKWIFF